MFTGRSDTDCVFLLSLRVFSLLSATQRGWREAERQLLLSLSPRLPVCLSPALRTAAAASVCVQQQHPTDPQLEADFLRKHNKNNARIEQYSRQISLTTSGSTPFWISSFFLHRPRRFFPPQLQTSDRTSLPLVGSALSQGRLDVILNIRHKPAWCVLFYCAFHETDL